jgi:hypothetical protein
MFVSRPWLCIPPLPPSSWLCLAIAAFTALETRPSTCHPSGAPSCTFRNFGIEYGIANGRVGPLNCISRLPNQPAKRTSIPVCLRAVTSKIKILGEVAKSSIEMGSLPFSAVVTKISPGCGLPVTAASNIRSCPATEYGVSSKKPRKITAWQCDTSSSPSAQSIKFILAVVKFDCG